MIYAVNKRTKEHRHVFSRNAYCVNPDAGDWRYVQADADGWIEWQGGECPLPNDQPCEAKTHSGECQKFKAAGHVIGWKKAIAYYRPILDTDTKPEPPAWDGEGLPPVGCECEVRHLHSTDLEWRRIKITSITNDYVVGYIRDDRESAIRRGPLLEFRPTRSEEDRAVEEMRAVIDACDAQSVDGRLSALYRAGYRKTGGE